MTKLTKPKHKVKHLDILSWDIVVLDKRATKAYFCSKNRTVYIDFAAKHAEEIYEHFSTGDILIIFPVTRKYFENTGEAVTDMWKVHPMCNYKELQTWRLLHNL